MSTGQSCCSYVYDPGILLGLVGKHCRIANRACTHIFTCFDDAACMHPEMHTSGESYNGHGNATRYGTRNCCF